MGLQTWPPSQPTLSSMACLDVETPSICRVLQLCLQQRRTREQLVEQGVMPPLKTPAAFHEQIRSLERAKTGSFLKHKLCRRPQRSELVRMHILQETQAGASLQATQMKLKRARLADDLKERLAQRPGPMELVEKNILPVVPAVGEVTNEREKANSKAPDIYSFEEDSPDALSPEQPCSQETPSSTLASLGESGGTETNPASSQPNSAVQHSPPPNSQSDSVKPISTSAPQSIPRGSPPQPPATVVHSITPGPVLVKQSVPKPPGDRSRSKKSKEPKPWVKKLKYHQYIPPDQKPELLEAPMDSAYARLLQQQQQFLQLQILSRQQQQYNYAAALPATVKPATEVQSSCSSVLGANAASAPVRLRHTLLNHKLEHLPAHLDDMKVAELKVALKRRSLPVSGTKTDLIERLKAYQETSATQTTAAMDTNTLTAAPKHENIRFTPPVSPIASKVSSLSFEESSLADSPAHHSDALSPTYTRSSPKRFAQEEFPSETRCYGKDPTHVWPLHGKDSERDKRLHEKERQIEELMRKLEQEQRLVEELKMQLEVEKMSQQGDSPPPPSPLCPLRVKEEHGPPLTCSVSCVSPGRVKQEAAADQCHLAPPCQFLLSHQTIKQPETPQPAQAGAQILKPASPLATAAAFQLPANCIKLHTTVSSAAPGLVQTSGQVPQKTEASAAPKQQCTTHTLPPTETWEMDTSAQSLPGTFPESGCPAGALANRPHNNSGPGSKSPSCHRPPLIVQPPSFTNQVAKCKDPPPYEDAVKQTRSLLKAVQGPTASSQQMDDLFDVLIESGEISPFVKPDPPTLEKPLPVTASVTTLPVNTVLSRPPPVVQVAQLPLKPSNGLAALIPDTQMDTLLECTLGADAGQQTLKLIDDLHSPIVTMEVGLDESTPPSALTLHGANMDNMDWLDLTLSVPADGISPLDMSTSADVLSPDFLASIVLC